MRMKSSVSADGRQLTIILGSRFDFQQVKEFKNLFDEEASQCCQEFVVDLNDTDHLDSAALGTLIAMRKSMSSKKFCILNPKPQIKKILNSFKLDRKFTIE